MEPLSSDNTWRDKDYALSGFLLGVGYGRDINEDLNIDNLREVPEKQLESAAIIDVKTNTFDARIRLENMLTSGQESSQFDNESQIFLQRIKFRWDISRNTDLTFGKLNERFDEGLSFHPLNFFEDNLQGMDFEDKRGRETGFPLIKMSVVENDWSMRLIYSDDTDEDAAYQYINANNGYNRGLRQWVATLRYYVGSATLNLIAQKPQDQEVGIGSSFTQVIGNNVALYGSWFARRGTRVPIHRNVFLEQSTDYTANDVYIEESPISDYRINENSLYHRWLLGASWTSDSLFSASIEWSHDDRGMDNEQWGYWKSVVAFHNSLNDDDARSINLAYDSAVLLYRRQDHLFLKLSKPLYDCNVSVSALMGVDKSVVSGARVAYQGATEWEAWFDVSLRSGSTYSEFGSVSSSSETSLGLRYFL
jgi:hypothetical protein